MSDGAKSIFTAEEFRQVGRLDQAIIVLCFRDRELSFPSAQAARQLKGQWPIFQLFADDLPTLWQWINETFPPVDADTSTVEGIVWLKKGAVVDSLADSDKVIAETILRVTYDCFVKGKSRAAGAPREMVAFDTALLNILCCPDTHQTLTLVDAPLVEKLNRQIEGGGLKNLARNAVKEKLSGGLLRADGAVLYPMRHNIPILLVDEAIALK